MPCEALSARRWRHACRSCSCCVHTRRVWDIGHSERKVKQEMNEKDPGGRDAPRHSSPAEQVLEMELADVARAAADLLAHARAIDPVADQAGHARSRTYSDAIQLLKVSAKLGHTVAELRGSRFEHTINVRRQEFGGQSFSSADVDTEPALLALGKDVLWDWRNKRTYVLDPTRTPDGRPGGSSEEGGIPHPNSEGSNGNFVKSQPEEPGTANGEFG